MQIFHKSICIFLLCTSQWKLSLVFPYFMLKPYSPVALAPHTLKIPIFVQDQSRLLIAFSFLSFPTSKGGECKVEAMMWRQQDMTISRIFSVNIAHMSTTLLKWDLLFIGCTTVSLSQSVFSSMVIGMTFLPRGRKFDPPPLSCCTKKKKYNCVLEF